MQQVNSATSGPMVFGEVGPAACRCSIRPLGCGVYGCGMDRVWGGVCVYVCVCVCVCEPPPAR